MLKSKNKIFFNFQWVGFDNFLLEWGKNVTLQNQKNFNNNFVKKCNYHIYWKLRNIDNIDPCCCQKNFKKISIKKKHGSKPILAQLEEHLTVAVF